MVTKVTVNRKQEFTITYPGAEAEYVAIIKALTIGISCIKEESPKHIAAKETLSMLLFTMLPNENQVTLCV